jgi:hypothetical protein
MKRNLRITLLIIGIIVICCSLLALSYVFWPLADSSMQSTLAPTLLTPP